MANDFVTLPIVSQGCQRASCDGISVYLQPSLAGDPFGTLHLPCLLLAFQPSGLLGAFFVWGEGKEFVYFFL